MTIVVPRLPAAVAGFLHRHGAPPTRALVPLDDWRAHHRGAPMSPHRDGDPALRVPDRPELVPAPTVSPRDRALGAMLGLAAGDALGTTLEFEAPGTFRPIDDIVGGGPFGLRPGQWTDDTAMACCLAESLLECGVDDADQLRRYIRWRDDGYWSSTGRCFDIGGTVARALAAFERTGRTDAAPGGERDAGNGSLMRLAPVVLYRSGDPAGAVALAAASSRTTHRAPAAVDACRYLAALMVGAVRGASKDALLAPHYEPEPGIWSAQPLHPAVAEVAGGSFLRKQPPAIRGTGYAVHALEAALWAFATTDDFRSGALAAVNLGEDADTTGAIYGQLAGACYGASGIPAGWVARLTRRSELERLAERLHEAATGATGAPDAALHRPTGDAA